MDPDTAQFSRTDRFLAQARAELALESQAGAPASCSPETVRWLCLVPAWTPVLAARCQMPSWGNGPDEALLEAWRADGFIESTHTPLSIDEAGQVEPSQHLFWMPREARATWLARTVADVGRERLALIASDVARRILAQPSDRHMPSATWRWAVVASHATSQQPTLRAAFEHELNSALEQNRPDQAWLWIEALQRVADIVPGEATTLHQRAVRRLALFDRQRNDRALLADYLPRQALFEAYREVVTGPDDVWAVHYLGGGGVGKTMLMRALTSGTAQHLPPGFSLPPTVTARIDFDHINPDYPARRPGLLFAHLAEELRLKDDSLRASEGFSLLFNKIALLHERAGGEGTPDADVEDVLNVFAWACGAVAGAKDARVVLLLDTCEELARLGPDGRLPESVERTFELLERLQAKLPSLRVVFCGRRPLAGTYAGGEVVTSRLPSRPWLRLHRVSAFSEAEAHVYLQRTGVPDRLVAPVLSRSVAAASSSGLGLPGDDEPRYSPFSLSVYAAWIARQGDVEPDAILGDPVDHFVRIRILDRIHNADVRRLLPHVALLGRFDEPTLRACADLRADVADAVLREVGSQEWIDRQAGGSYAVEPELRARLLRYFERESPRELHEARRRVLPVLWTSYEAGTDDRVPDEPVVQALVQLVRDDRESLLRAWRTVDERIVLGGHADWGLRVLGRLLADDSALASATVDAGAWGAFATTYAECVLHEQGAAHAGDLWRKAWEGAQQIQEPHERASLLVRIASGGLTAAAAASDTEVAFDLWALRLYNLAADRAVSLTAPSADVPLGHRRKPVHAAIAALMTCADMAERHPDPLEPAPPLLERLAALVVEVRHAPARAIALTCIGRFAARRQDADLAHKRFVDALQTLGESADRDLLPCLQWPKRLDAASWVTLEAMRGLAGLEPVEETIGRFAALPTPRSEIAINRLESLQLRLTAAVRVPHESAVSPSRKGTSIGAGDVAVPDSLGQELVRPRAVAIALDHVECGRPAEGLRLLAELTSVATSARNTTVATAVERARIDAVTRLRLGEHGRLSRQLVSGAGLLPLGERARMRAFVPDADAVAFDDGLIGTRWDAHCVWRAMRATGHREQQHLGEAGRRLLTLRDTDGEGEWARASVALDLVECSELGADADLASQGLSPASPEDWWSRHPAQPERALRLWIRSAALGVSPGGPTTALVRRLGVRRAAAIAMEEGELLALRLPTQALRLLALSLTWYEDAHDALGIWQVTTLLALTRVRAGVPRDSIDLTALQAAHHPLVVAGTDRGSRTLPPWSWVEGVTQLPLADSAVTVEWAPWLHRVIALRHWVSGGVRPEVLFTTPEWLPIELRDWPLDTLGGAAVSTSETRLAAAPGGQASEVPPPPASVPTMAPRPLPPSAPPPSALPSSVMPPRPESASVPVPVQAPVSVAASRVPWLIVGLVALLGILFLVGWLLLSVRSGATDLPSTSGTPTGSSDAFLPGPPPASDEPGPNADGVVADAASPLVSALGVIALLAVTGAGAWLWLRRRTASTPAPLAANPWTAQVSATGSEVTGGRLAALDVSVSIASDRGEPVTTAAMRVRRTDAYSGLDALRQPPSGTALSVAFASTPAPARLWLEVTLGTSWPCWEALLWTGVVDGTHLRPAVVRHVRSPRPARQISPGGVPGPWPVVTVAATAGDERQAAYAWEPSLRAGHVTLAPVAAEAVRAGVPRSGVRLVHVTAQPVETPQGLFFELAGGDRWHVQESLESMASDRGTLFDASQLAHTFPDATCMLLQPPRRPTLDLTPAGRETCACLRVIAAALAEHGVPLVIVMPPLDGELAAHIVRLLGRRIAYLRGGALDPHEFTVRVREVVLGHAQRLLPRDAAIELALQVGVYAL